MKTQIRFTQLCGRVAVACCSVLTTLGLSAQTLDIADFLVLEPGNQWLMEGNASLVYNGVPYNPDVGISIETFEGQMLHEVQTTQMLLQGIGSVTVVIFKVEFSVNQDLMLSLDDTGLYLHSRVGSFYAAGNLEDLDEEVYITPAKLLPRLITVGNYYDFTANLESGDVQDRVFVETIEPVETSLGTIEAVKLVLFTDDDVPVILWLGRNVGAMKAQVATTFDESPFNMEAILTGMNMPWEALPIDGIWSATLAAPEGWRFSDWFEYFWTTSVDSPWIYHLGLQWAYCTGDMQNLWMYIQGLGWMWTSDNTFPWFYDASTAKFLYYVYGPGSYWFFDVETGEYVDLTP